MLKGENKKKVFLERNVYVSMYIKIKKRTKDLHAFELYISGIVIMMYM